LTELDWYLRRPPDVRVETGVETIDDPIEDMRPRTLPPDSEAPESLRQFCARPLRGDVSPGAGQLEHCLGQLKFLVSSSTLFGRY
jgi:hypothetical protein